MRTKVILALAGVVVAAGAFVAGMLVERHFPALWAADPNPPELLGPADGAVLNKDVREMWEFTWSKVPEAERYYLYMKHQATSSALISRELDLPVFRMPYPHGFGAERPYDKGWTWKVKVQVAGRWSKWSEVRTFDIESNSK